MSGMWTLSPGILNEVPPLEPSFSRGGFFIIGPRPPHLNGSFSLARAG